MGFNLGRRINRAGRNIGRAARNAGRTVGNAAREAADTVGDVVRETADTVGDVSRGAVETVRDAAGRGIRRHTRVDEAADAAVDTIEQGLGEPVAQAIQTSVDNFDARREQRRVQREEQRQQEIEAEARRNTLGEIAQSRENMRNELQGLRTNLTNIQAPSERYANIDTGVEGPEMADYDHRAESESFDVARQSMAALLEQFNNRAEGRSASIDSLLDEAENIDFNDHAVDASQYRTGLEDLVATMEAGMGQEELDEGLSRFAQMSGIGDSAEDYRNYMEEQRGVLDEGIEGMEGLTAEQRDLYEREAALNEQHNSDMLSDQLDAIHAGSGSSMRYLRAADEARRQIADERVANDLAIAERDFQMKEMQFNQKQDSYRSLLESGMINQQQYEQGLRSDRLSALEGYAELHSQAIAENEQDMAGKIQHANNIYTHINTQLGVEQGEIERIKAQYDLTITPIIDRANLANQQQTLLDSQYRSRAQAVTDQIQRERDLVGLQTDAYNRDIQPILDQITAVLNENTVDQGFLSQISSIAFSDNPVFSTVASSMRLLFGGEEG